MADDRNMPSRAERRDAARTVVNTVLDALEIEGHVRAVSGQKVMTRIDGVLVIVTVSAPTWAEKKPSGTCTNTTEQQEEIHGTES